MVTSQSPDAPADSSNSGGTNPWDGTIKTAYQQFVGRTPSAQEMIPHYSNPDGLPGVINSIKTSPEAQKYAESNPNGPDSFTMPSGIDPRLATVYSKYKFAPTERGSGFGDWQYWQDRMGSGDAPADYFINRLDTDLAGTGPDVGYPGSDHHVKSTLPNSGSGPLPPGANVRPDGVIDFNTSQAMDPNARPSSDPNTLLNQLLKKYQADQQAKQQALISSGPNSRSI